MKTRRILQPGQPGTKKLLERYGDNLICVRYRYDAQRKRMLKTIEIIVDDRPWEPDTKESPRDTLVNIRIAIHEMEPRRQVKAAGGKWDPERKVWRLPYEKAAELGLSDRIVDDDPS